VGYDGNIIPRRVGLRYNAEAHDITLDVNCEGETFAQVASNGDIPGDGDVDLSIPPLPPLPPLPDIPIIIPGGLEPTAVGPTKLLLHDNNKGLIYTTDFDASSPHWLSMNSGLTLARYIAINKIIVNPLTGAIHVATRGGTQGFIAYSAGLGQPFTIVEDVASIETKLGGSDGHVLGLGINPINGQVAYVIGTNAAVKLYIGSGTSFSAGAAITARRDSIASVTYGFGKWRVTGFISSLAARLWIISADGGTLVSTITPPETDMYHHIAVGTTDKMIHTTPGNITNSTGNGSAFSAELGGGLIFAGTYKDNDLACDPTGQLIMLRYDTGKRGKSSDGGTTWATMGNLPFTSTYVFDYAGPGEGNTPATSRWVAAYSVIRYSPDFGTTWYNKEGDITSIAPTPVISIVKVLEY
jgi:hypothetical protein